MNEYEFAKGLYPHRHTYTHPPLTTFDSSPQTQSDGQSGRMEVLEEGQGQSSSTAATPEFLAERLVHLDLGQDRCRLRRLSFAVIIAAGTHSRFSNSHIPPLCRLLSHMYDKKSITIERRKLLPVLFALANIDVIILCTPLVRRQCPSKMS